MVCEEWLDFKAFASWAMANGYRDDLTIERKDNDGNYCPENCTFIPFSRQSKNRRTVRHFKFNGKTKSLSDWAKICGIKQNTLADRLRRGWSIEKALTTKTGGCFR